PGEYLGTERRRRAFARGRRSGRSRNGELRSLDLFVMAVETPPPLGPEDAARLTEFARACKAAARAVMLYPPAHPAIAVSLGRIVQLTSPSSLQRPLQITVLPHNLLLEDRAPARRDSAIVELADLLHNHLI